MTGRNDIARSHSSVGEIAGPGMCIEHLVDVDAGKDAESQTRFQGVTNTVFTIL